MLKRQNNSYWLLIFFIIFSCAEKPTETTDNVVIDSSKAIIGEDWFEALHPDQLVKDGSILDMSNLLHKPAGAHGFLNTEGAKFYFEDGKEAKFWGGNMSAEACFPEKEEAELMAKRLAQAGVNLIRLHHIDVMKVWSDKYVDRSLFGGQNPATSRELNPEYLDKLEYLIYCLKQNGIYVFLSHASNRMIASGDGFPGPDEAKEDIMPAFKYEGYFDPFLIELQKEYTKQLLDHVNPYTGLALKDDPVLAMMEINNENHLYHYYKKRSWFTITSDYYRDMLSSLFNVWLVDKYGSDTRIRRSWKVNETDTVNLSKSESLDQKSVVFPIAYDRDFYAKYSENKKQDIFDFLTHLQQVYYANMYTYIKSLGLKVPLAPTSQWMGVLPVSRNVAKYDFADAHSYWKHPSKIYNYIEGQEFISASMLKDSSGGNIGKLSKYRIHDKPYTISEWNNCLPNPYRSEGVGLMAAYSSLNDWHPMHYALYHQRFEGLDTINAFEAFVDPVFTSLYPAASLLFHRRDVKEAHVELYQHLAIDEVMRLDEDVDINPHLGMISKAGISFSDLPEPENNDLDDLDELPIPPVFESTTGELIWNTQKGTLRINSSGTQAGVGFIGNATIETDHAIFQADNEFANLYLTAIDTNAIAVSDRMLLTAVADAHKKGVTLTKDGKFIATTGQYPFLMEPVVATITIKKGGDFEVYAIDQRGQRKQSVATTSKGDGFTFNINADYGAVHYEIIKK